jgi:DNA primase
VLALHRQAAAFYREQLAGSWVPAYLESRSLARALDEPWLAGHAPHGWTTLVDRLREDGADAAALLASGLATRARTGHLIDRFRDRLVLPIRTPAGDIVAFIGRAHPEADPDRVPRYLNSPETALYAKGEHLYGLYEAAAHLARGALPVLVEGPLDAIAVTTGTAGRCAGIALWGTTLTRAHLDALAATVDLRQRGIVVATDPDEAGLAAAGKALSLLAGRGLSATAAALPLGENPAAMLHTGGPAVLTAALLERAVSLADVVIDHRIDKWKTELENIEGRVGALRDVAPLVAGLPLDDIRRQGLRLAERLDLVLGVVQQEIAAYIALEQPPARLHVLAETARRSSTPHRPRGPGYPLSSTPRLRR